MRLLGVRAASATRPRAYRSGSTQALANRLNSAFASVAMDPSWMATHIPPRVFTMLTPGLSVRFLGVRAASATRPSISHSMQVHTSSSKPPEWCVHFR